MIPEHLLLMIVLLLNAGIALTVARAAHRTAYELRVAAVLFGMALGLGTLEVFAFVAFGAPGMVVCAVLLVASFCGRRES